MQQYPQELFPDIGLSDDDQTPDLRPKKELPPTSTAKHQVEGNQSNPLEGTDLP
ncbi:hypothetical protein RBA14_23195 [Mycobacteroides abscessus subsp. abscessus]|uniref:hypothetical protein n=1 Tax=Mycobacteroides abscessus TaxID=36809 RepID=UPI0013DDC859|nr:hypothetical protein [Mycobacteroides abscessus]